MNVWLHPWRCQRSVSGCILFEEKTILQKWQRQQPWRSQWSVSVSVSVSVTITFWPPPLPGGVMGTLATCNHSLTALSQLLTISHSNITLQITLECNKIIFYALFFHNVFIVINFILIVNATTQVNKTHRKVQKSKL